MTTRTFSANPADALASRKWYVIDATGVPLGRLSSKIASVLSGKHKPTFTRHVDTGDYVVVVNAAKVKLTGNKLDARKFFWHTGFPGGIKDRTQRQLLNGRFPERVLENAVRRMIPGGPLGRQQMRNLRVYAGDKHPHEAQSPEKLDVAAMNSKNVRAE